MSTGLAAVTGEAMEERIQRRLGTRSTLDVLLHELAHWITLRRALHDWLWRGDDFLLRLLVLSCVVNVVCRVLALIVKELR